MFATSLETRLLRLVQNTQVGVLRVSRSPKSSSEPSALIIPPARVPGGIGDDAMLSSIIDHLLSHNFKRIGIVTFDTQHKWRTQEFVTDVVGAVARADKFRLVNMLNRYTHVYCVGADVLDGFYSDMGACYRLSLVELAGKLGLKTTIVGFSFNEKPTSNAVKAFSKLPSNVQICCRESISRERLSRYIQHPINLVSDVAFLLKPVHQSELVTEIAGWVANQKAVGRTVVGFNAKHLYPGEGKKMSNRDLINIYASALTTVFQQDPNISFLLIPHDTRGDLSDVALAEAIFNALPAEMQPYCKQVPLPCRAAEIKGICAHLDMVITGRMHLAIACLGQVTPVAGITYQGKFEGLFEHFHFDLEKLLIGPENALQEGKLAAFMLAVIPQREAIKKQIQAELGKVQSLARKNFANLETQENFPVKSI
jgi:polysaccharide pyruvyl transferase WcaK-like protein